MNEYTESASIPARPAAGQTLLAPDRLRLVSAHELQQLQGWLARGQIPPDFEAKLAKLSQGNLSHRAIEQNCRTIIALLQAADEGCFREACPADHERLLRVLAYVRKDDDAIPDYRSDGFTDDQQEIRVVAQELVSLLQSFKSWRLRHQVPAMWNTATSGITTRF